MIEFLARWKLCGAPVGVLRGRDAVGTEPGLAHSLHSPLEW